MTIDHVVCHKYSFVFFYIIMIRLEAWLTNWLTVNLLKKYKIKRKFTSLKWLPNIFHLVSWNHRNFHSCCALMKILMFSTHSMKYIWYSPQKSKYPLFILWSLFSYHVENMATLPNTRKTSSSILGWVGLKLLLCFGLRFSTFVFSNNTTSS